MKLLFDQNLSPRLAMKLADHYPDSAHVMTHALDHALDDVDFKVEAGEVLGIIGHNGGGRAHY